MNDNNNQPRKLEIHFSENAPFSPFADPAIGSAFANVEVAGLAADSFIRAVLRKVEPLVSAVGQVIEVTPQHHDKYAGRRGTRVDILVRTDTKEIIIFEVQVIFDKTMPIRNLLAFSGRFSNSFPENSDLSKTAPRIIIINLLCYDLEDERKNYVEPIMLMYPYEPVAVADDHLVMINIQMPTFLDRDPDLNEPLDCWLYTWYESHKQGKSPKEIIAMSPKLQQYATENTGFEQYVERFSNIAGDAALREEYNEWLQGMLQYYGEMAGARDSGKAESDAAWSGVVTQMQSELADKDAELADKDAELADKDSQLAAALARIAELESAGK